MPDISPSNIPSNALTTDMLANTFPMTADTGKIATEALSYEGDMAVYNATRNFSWVSGIKKNDSFVYFSKSSTVGGAVTFYITDNGLSTGNAVYTNVYADSITITPYGSAAAYQILTPTVSTDKKTITAQVTQTTAALLNALQFTTAANNVPCVLLVLGD